MKKNFISGVFFCVLMLLVGCAPGAGSGSLAMPLKLKEVWEMQAFRPGNTESQTFPIELYSEPEYEDGLWFADAEVGKFEGTVLYNPREDILGVLVLLTRGNDPNLVFCVFSPTKTGNSQFSGTSFFGRGSEMQNLDKVPRDRFARCEIKKSAGKGF